LPALARLGLPVPAVLAGPAHDPAALQARPTIVRGLLAVQQGRIWAENRADGGAEFTLVVPAAARASAVQDRHAV